MLSPVPFVLHFKSEFPHVNISTICHFVTATKTNHSNSWKWKISALENIYNSSGNFNFAQMLRLGALSPIYGGVFLQK